MPGLILKILEGPNVGAVARIVDGETVVGRDFDCDIVLSEPSVASRHFAIVLNGEQLSLKALDQAVYVETNPLHAHDETAYTLYTPIKLGNTIIAIGAEGDDAWARIKYDALIGLQIEVEDEDATPPGEDEPSSEEGGADPAVLSNQDEAVSELQTGESQAGESAAAQNRPDRSIRYAVTAAIVGAVFLMLAGGGALLFGSSGDGEEDAQQAQLNPSEALAKLLRENQLDDTITFEFQANNRLRIQGYVWTPADLVKLRSLLTNAGYAPRIQVEVVDRQISALKILLDRLGVSWQVEKVLESGEIRLSGYIATRAVLNSVVTLLGNEIPRLRPFDIQVSTAEDVARQLEDRLKAEPWAHKLTYRLSPDAQAPKAIKVEGKLEEENKRRAEHLISEFAADLNDGTFRGSQVAAQLTIDPALQTSAPPAPAPVPTVVAQPKKAPPPMAPPVEVKKLTPKPVKRFHFTGVISGDVVLAVASDAKTYRIGSVLPDGFKITEITGKSVLVQSGDKTKTYHIGEGN